MTRDYEGPAPCGICRGAHCAYARDPEWAAEELLCRVAGGPPIVGWADGPPADPDRLVWLIHGHAWIGFPAAELERTAMAIVATARADVQPGQQVTHDEDAPQDVRVWAFKLWTASVALLQGLDVFTMWPEEVEPIMLGLMRVAMQDPDAEPDGLVI